MFIDVNRYERRWNDNLCYRYYEESLLPMSIPVDLESIVPENQRFLRMMVKRPGSDLLLPDELSWIRNTIEFCENFQSTFNMPQDRFIYVTVRCGVAKPSTDTDWHVDGFSMRTPHIPEQNYIWTNSEPTEYLDQGFVIPADFDPFVHNLHNFFQDRADERKVKILPSHHLNIVDPYMIHRRPASSVGGARKMFRISFVPVEIEDDTCTQNPLLPSGPYNREDIRKKLISY